MIQGIVGIARSYSGFWIVHTFPQLGNNLIYVIFQDSENWKSPISEQTKAFSAMCVLIDDDTDSKVPLLTLMRY